MPDCVTLTPAALAYSRWLPETCAYRRLAEGNPIPSWHPLITGDPDSVVDAGQSRVRSGDRAGARRRPADASHRLDSLRTLRQYCAHRSQVVTDPGSGVSESIRVSRAYPSSAEDTDAGPGSAPPSPRPARSEIFTLVSAFVPSGNADYPPGLAAQARRRPQNGS